MTDRMFADVKAILWTAREITRGQKNAAKQVNLFRLQKLLHYEL